MKDAAELRQLLKSENEDERLRGVKALAEAGLEQHLADLYRAMGDASWRVRKEAVEQFFRVPNAAALSGEIIELLHSQDNAGLRNAAVEILTRFGRQAIPELLEELHCKDHDVRKFIIDVLGDIGDERAVEGLLGALEDEDTNVRAAAAENLGKLKAVDAAPALLKSMGDGDLMFRFTALESLAQMEASVEVDRLLAFREEKLLRKALFDCLGKIGDAAAIEVLVAGLADDMRDVAEAAALALVRLAQRGVAGVEEAMAGMAGSPRVERLAQLLESRSDEVRRAGVTLLGQAGDDMAVAALVPLLEDQVLAQQAAEALVTVGRTAQARLVGLWETAPNPQKVYLAYLYGEAACMAAVTRLHEGLRHADPALRHACAHALGCLGDVSALAALVEGLNDESEEVRGAIVAALTRLGELAPSATFAAIKPLLEHEHEDQRAGAVTVLGRLSGAEIDRALVFALKDEAVEVRREAVRALEGRDGEELMQALMLTLNDEDVDVRRLATETLGRFRDPDLVGALQLALNDEDIWVRATAVRSLGAIPSPEALTLVESALDDPVGLVVIAALETLVEVTPQATAEPLRRALDHDDEEVVNSALKLLARLGSDAWIDSHAERLLNHKNWEVRISTARSLAGCRGPASMALLEARLLVEGEDLVRHELRDLLGALEESAD